MPTPTKGPRLGGSPAHQRLMLANLAKQLFDNDRITTTEAKAKRLRPHAERLITIAKKGDLAAVRRVARVITDKGVVNKLMTEIAPAMNSRDGGYTRIIKIGFRKGDSAPMAVIELVKEPTVKKKPKNTRRKNGNDDAATEGSAKKKSKNDKTSSKKPAKAAKTQNVTEEVAEDTVEKQEMESDATDTDTKTDGQ